MSIVWGDVEFEGPYLIEEWDPPRKAAVYAIMMKPNAREKPGTFRVLYFGESGNLSERGFWRSHHKFGCWINKAGSTSNLFIGYHAMPNSTEADRRSVEERLISQYRPACND